jgi:hypothetical protein
MWGWRSTVSIAWFCDHLGQAIASPAVIVGIGNRFRREVDAFAKTYQGAGAASGQAGSHPLG